VKRLSKRVFGRIRRRKRIRLKIKGTPEQPRLSVFRSARHIYAQIVDDVASVTLVCASSLDKELAGKIKTGGNKDGSKQVGTLLAKKAKAAGIKRVVFDRGGYLYHGRVQALAEAAREGGLEF
jgi:large subunit ribosomal protein L18